MKLLISEAMRKNNIESVLFTNIHIERMKLVTKEVMEDYCTEKMFGYDVGSVNDDLDSIFEGLRIGEVPKKCTFTYFLPKLTRNEIDLVAKKDPMYMKTFYDEDPDVKENEMKLSLSRSKYVKATCIRSTILISLSEK